MCVQLSKQFAVIGLGRFGRSLAVTLSQLGAEVLAVDVDEERTNAVAPFVTESVQADATNERVLRELGLRNFDVVVVAVSAFEASLLATIALKEAGVRKVVVKAASEVHGKILERIGADTVVFPERDMGERVAFSLVSGSVIDYIELSPDYGIAEVVVTGPMVGRSLRNLNLRHKMGLNVLALKRNGSVDVALDPDEPFREGDVLLAMGPNEGVRQLTGMMEKR